jgi:hypothetical protein
VENPEEVGALSKGVDVLWMFGFITMFLVATYTLSRITSLAPALLRGTASPPELLAGTAYCLATLFSILILGRMIYWSERTAGRVKRRVRLFE